MMANDCNYEMKVTGHPEDIKEFIKVIQADYNYIKQEFSYERHLYRVFEAEYCELEEEDAENNIWSCIIYGYCAWSVYCCMLEGPSTYYNENYPYHTVYIDGKNIEILSKGTSLIKESAKLNLTIEVFSEEIGMGFQEHFVIEYGECIINECVDYKEYYWDKKEHPTLEEFNAEHGTNFTLEDDSDQDTFYIGGFGEWVYDEF